MPEAGGGQTNERGSKVMNLLDLAQGYPGNAHQRVVTEGMVYVPEDVPAGHAVLFRFMITCCAADAQPLAILVSGEGVEKLPKDTWVRVEGVIDVTRMKDQEVVTIRVDHLEQIPKPAAPYL